VTKGHKLTGTRPRASAAQPAARACCRQRMRPPPAPPASFDRRNAPGGRWSSSHLHCRRTSGSSEHASGCRGQRRQDGRDRCASEHALGLGQVSYRPHLEVRRQPLDRPGCDRTLKLAAVRDQELRDAAAAGQELNIVGCHEGPDARGCPHPKPWSQRPLVDCLKRLRPTRERRKACPQQGKRAGST
jgi:hypothetical protein